MGTLEEVSSYIKEGSVNSSVEVSWLEDGNHDLKPRKASGFSHQEHINYAIQQVADFLLKLESAQ